MKKQNIIIVLVFLCILTLATGYVIFRTNVEVTQKTAPAEDLEVIFKSIGNITEVDCVDSIAVISEDRKNVSISVPNLMKKGAYALFPITIKNIGNLPAKLQSISQYGMGQDASISVSYDGIGVTDMVLNPGDEREFAVKVMWKRNLLAEQSNYKFMIRFNYVQA